MKRKAILVASMHRSGTSAFTRVLALHGAALPKRLLQTVRGNESGHWEPERINNLHDELLSAGNTSWDDVDELPPELPSLMTSERYVQGLAKLLEDEYGDAPLFISKDPRTARLMPLWKAALSRLNVEPHVLITVRNPLEVADSLRQRDQKREGVSVMLWLRYMLAVERDTRDLPRCFAEYDRLLTDWRSLVKKVFTRLNIELPGRSAEVEKQVDAFLQGSQRHHRREPAEFLDGNDAIAWVGEIYRAFQSAAGGDEGSLGQLDVIASAARVRSYANQLLCDCWISDPGLNGPVAGVAKASIDAVNRGPVKPGITPLQERLLVEGWAAVAPENGIGADEVLAVITGQDGSVHAARARAIYRHDVNAYYRQPGMGAVGFEAFLDTGGLKGRYTLRFYVRLQGRLYACPQSFELKR